MMAWSFGIFFYAVVLSLTVRQPVNEHDVVLEKRVHTVSFVYLPFAHTAVVVCLGLWYNCLSGAQGIAPFECKRNAQSRNNMPDAPPGSNEQHASVCQVRRKYFCVKQKNETQSRVLDAGFYGNGTSVFTWNAE